MNIRLTGFFLFLTLICSALLGSFSYDFVESQNVPDVFVGIDLAFGDVEQVKQLADEVASYTNLFILGCTAVTQNRFMLEEACQYLFDKGLFFIVYQEYPLDFTLFSIDKSTWFETAKTRWGNHFLGIYYSDEIGGRQLHHNSDWMVVPKADSYEEASSEFNTKVNGSISWFRDGYSSGEDISLFTSDYALYWFDYNAGYDVLLAQFGWNYSRQLNAGLCRGAAAAQNKDWGAIITWTYTQPPYIESGEELYNDLLLAYDNGAKYIAIFNSNKNYSDGILKQEHLDAIRQFWQYSQQNPRKLSPINERTAYMLPKDYAYGFRGPNDKIWGLWEADDLSVPISINLGSLLEKYSSKLDIIYEEFLQMGHSQHYNKLVNWNDTTIISSPSLNATSSPSRGVSFTELIGIKYLTASIQLGLVIIVAFLAAVVILTYLRRTRIKPEKRLD